MFDRILEWDRETFVYLNNLGVEKYDVFWSTVTKFPPWIPLLVLFIVLFFVKRPRRESFMMIGTLLVMVLFVTTLTDLTKEVVARLRPNNDTEINNDYPNIKKTVWI